MLQEKTRPDPDCSNSIKVLLVEDNEAFRMLLTSQLEALGCCVRAAPNASGFLSKLAEAECPFDLAVIDLRLPDLSGEQIVTWLEESEQQTVHSLPVLFVTGHPQDVSSARFKKRSKIRVLGKPYRFNELADAVTNLLVQGARH
jgi:two-component system cell cycle sensor histidine kinase/response regulator CckA